MFNTSSDVETLLRIGAEVEVFLVIPDACRVFVVGVTIVVVDILTVLAVQELTVSTLEVNLQPSLGEGYCPEVGSADAYLWDGLGIGAFGKSTY